MASRDQDDRPDALLEIDHFLVSALEQVQQAVAIYLAELSQDNLEKLRESLILLDDRTAAGDHWAQSAASSAAWGYGDIHLAIGQTGSTPVIESESSALFNAQVALVRAAKAVVLRPGSSTVDILRSSLAAVEDRTA